MTKEKLDKIYSREEKYPFERLDALMSFVTEELYSIRRNSLNDEKEENKKVFTIREIKEKLLYLNPSIIDNGLCNPYIYDDVRKWYKELTNKQKLNKE